MRARSEVRLAAVAERVGCQLDLARARGAEGGAEGWSPKSWPPSVAQLLSGQPDEDGLERGLGHGEVGQRETARFGGLDHPRDEAIGTADLQLDAVGDRRGSA